MNEKEVEYRSLNDFKKAFFPHKEESEDVDPRVRRRTNDGLPNGKQIADDLLERLEEQLHRP
jgi:hypothetical protein